MIEEQTPAIGELEEANAKAEPSHVPGEATARLSRSRNFKIYWLGQSLSAVGDSFALIAMPLLVFEATGSVAQMGLVTATNGVGQIIAGIVGGSLADRVNRRRMMIGCDIARALLYATIPLFWALWGPQLWLIYVVTALGAVLGNLFSITNIAAVANLVERHQIIDANSRLQATYGLAFFVGPMLAGLVSHNLGGPAAAVGIDALSFTASFVTLLFVRLREEAANRTTVAQGSRIQELLAGVRFLWQQPVLRALTILFGLGNLLTFAGLDMFIYRLKHDLGQNDDTVGFVLGVASVGAIISALLAPAMRRRFGFGVSFIFASVVQAVAFMAIGLVPSVVLIMPSVVGFVFGERIRGINSVTLRQEITPDYLLGRVTAAFWTLLQVPGPFGAAIMTALAASYGAQPILLAMGLGGLALTVAALFTPIRLAHPERVYAVDK